MNKRDQILAALSAFASQRPGLEYGNYCSGWNDIEGRRAYFSEMRSITKDLHNFRQLLSAVSWRSSIGETELREAFSAYSGRLSIVDHHDGAISLSYCTGQYFPTEYRKAACAVLASALWAYARENAPVNAGPTEPHSNLQNLGDYLRKSFRKEFGRSIQHRYFD